MDRINLLSKMCKGWTREISNTIRIPFPTKLATNTCRNKKWSFTILIGTVTVISIIAFRIINSRNPSRHNSNPISPSEKVLPVADCSKATFISDVEEWKNDASYYENRAEAARRMLDCMQNNKTTLNLSQLHLTSLPDSISNLSSLTELNLSNNRFTSLPDSIFKLSSLTTLFLIDNQLTSLPDSISNLSSLTKLYLSRNPLTSLPDSIFKLSSLTTLFLIDNQLTSLPDSISKLSSLTTLNLSNNRFTSLPDSISKLSSLTTLSLSDNRFTSLPDSISKLSSLTELDLFRNRLTSLPDSISKLSSLTMLFLSGNQLTSLPDSISKLSSLNELYLSGNRLTSLPDSISKLSSLTELDLFRNRFTSLPNEILQLPNSCNVELANNSLSQVVLQRLQDAINTPNYNGPTIHFSIYESPSDLRPTEEILAELFQLAKLNSFEIPQSISDNASLNPWLNKLSYTADYKRGSKPQEAMAQLTLKYIQLAAENESFRDEFLAILTQSNDTCGDRVAYYFIQLGIAHRLHTMSLNDPRAIAKYLINTCWAIDQLKQVAQEKVKTLCLVDEIEVYLAYPIKLQERLEIDLNMGEMLYFSCSAVSEQELESVVEFVLSCRNNEEARMTYLTSHPKWLEVLTKRFGPGKGSEEHDNWHDENIIDESKRIELTQSLLSNS